MTTYKRSVTLTRTDSHQQEPCPCGCAECKDNACQLDCLVQPRFFYGQVLSDQDLTALLHWAQNKYRLTRFRHGWGVVCGLDVRCDPGADCAGVIVSPGYAIDCCGNDIVVCADMTVSLADICQQAEDPCGEPLRKPYEKEQEAERPVGREPMMMMGESKSAFGDVRAVDLYLQYEEHGEKLQTALGRSNCREAAKCEYSRTRETARVVWRNGSLLSDPAREAALRWKQQLVGYDEVIKRFVQMFGDSYESDAIKWLLGWLEEHPMREFCFVNDMLRDMASGYEAARLLPAVLYLMVMDYLIAALCCDCAPCDDDQGVRLARVWMRVGGETTRTQKPTCQVLAIDSAPPFHRPLHTDCWPAPLGQQNLGRYIWRRWDDARVEMANAGIRHLEPQTVQLPQTVKELYALVTDSSLIDDLWADADQPVQAQLLEMEPFGQRVVGFTAGRAKETAAETSASKRKK